MKTVGSRKELFVSGPFWCLWHRPNAEPLPPPTGTRAGGLAVFAELGAERSERTFGSVGQGVRYCI